MYSLNNLTDKSLDLCAVASILSKIFRRCRLPFFERECKGKCLYLSTNFILQQSGEKFDNQRCLKSCLFGNGGQKYNLNAFR